LAQKNEKIKGSKTVSIEQKEIGSFNTLEIGDNLEVYLEKGEKCGLKIEADDNLHDIINIDLNSNTLKISTSKKATSYKKLILRVAYTNDLKTVISKNDAIINAIEEIQSSDITFKTFDDSKLNLNVNSKNFILESDNNSKIELNLKSEKTTILLSKNASLKALIAGVDLKCDMYQKSKANLEGNVTNAFLRLDNNAEFTGKKLVIANAELIAESYSDCSINVNKSIIIDASGNSKIQLFGDQKVEIKQFIDNAVLSKKPTK